VSFVRHWLPALILVGGVVLIIARGGDETSWEGAFGIWGAGLSVWLLNYLYRLGVSGDRERRVEDEARDFYSRHGHWPDEQPPPR
jgi:hypothetical protein